MAVFYIATFPNGETLTRKSTREYGAAWRVMNEAGRVLESGFASCKTRASKAAKVAKTRWQATGAEVVSAAIVPEGFEKQLVAAKPWRVHEQYTDGRVRYVSGRGNKHLRFATEAEAQAEADRLASRPGNRSTYTAKR